MAHHRVFLPTAGLMLALLLSACGTRGEISAEVALDQFSSALVAEDYRAAYRVTSPAMRQWMGSHDALRDEFDRLCAGRLIDYDLGIEPAGPGFQAGIGTYTCESGKAVPMVVVAEEVQTGRWLVTDYSINPGVGDG